MTSAPILRPRSGVARRAAEAMRNGSVLVPLNPDDLPDLQLDDASQMWNEEMPGCAGCVDAPEYGDLDKRELRRIREVIPEQRMAEANCARIELVSSDDQQEVAVADVIFDLVDCRSAILRHVREFCASDARKAHRIVEHLREDAATAIRVVEQLGLDDRDGPGLGYEEDVDTAGSRRELRLPGSPGLVRELCPSASIDDEPWVLEDGIPEPLFLESHVLRGRESECIGGGLLLEIGREQGRTEVADHARFFEEEYWGDDAPSSSSAISPRTGKWMNAPRSGFFSASRSTCAYQPSCGP